MLVEVFKSGTHTDSSGQTHTFSDADLDAMVAAYDPDQHEAPVVIGHPKDNTPAYGWVKNLVRKGHSLFAELGELSAEFVEWVKAGRYKKRSISVYPDGVGLRHVGFLGAVPPAIKGLADVQFSEAGPVFEFSDGRFKTLRHVLGNLRDVLIDRFDLATADDAIPAWTLDDLDGEEQEAASAFKESEEEPMSDKSVQALEKRLEKMEADFAEQISAKDKEISDLKAENTQAKSKADKAAADQRRSEHAAFCEELAKAGKLTPKQKGFALSFMEVAHQAGEINFSEGEEDKKVVALAAFKSFLEELPEQVEFGETATTDKANNGGPAADGAADFGENVDPDRLELHNKALGLSQTEGITYSEAVSRLAKKGA